LRLHLFLGYLGIDFERGLREQATLRLFRYRRSGVRGKAVYLCNGRPCRANAHKSDQGSYPLVRTTWKLSGA